MYKYAKNFSNMCFSKNVMKYAKIYKVNYKTLTLIMMKMLLLITPDKITAKIDCKTLLAPYTSGIFVFTDSSMFSSQNILLEIDFFLIYRISKL